MIKNINTFIISLFTAVLVVIAYHFYTIGERSQLKNDYARLVASEDQAISPQQNQNITRTELIDFVIPANNSKQAVVAIEATKVSQNESRNEKYQRTNGSGVLISSNGYIVTNEHVVSEASDIKLMLEDKREFRAELIGTDKSSDIALLKIEATELPYLVFGDSDNLKIGEWVLAVGNPFQLSSSVTAGIVSAKARELDIFKRQGIESFIQTDAAVNPGNSGGALVNVNNQLVGINTAILTYSGKYEGFSFAIPSNLVQKVVEDLREYGVVQRAWLGASILNMNEKRANALGLDEIEGVFIDLIERDGAADRAGLKFEDVILSINSKPTSSKPQLIGLLAQYRPGDEIILEYLRDGKKLKTSVKLLNQLNTTDYVAVRKDKLFRDLGFELRDLDTEEKEKNNTTGVMVVSILSGSKIESVNMDPGYIITSFNGQKVKNVSHFKSLMQEYSGEIYLDGFYENYPRNWPYKFTK